MVVVVLSGCTAQDEIGARLDALHQVEFVICESLDINRIEVREERESDADPVKELWVATGHHALSNLHLSFGVPPGGMTNEVGPVTPLPASIVFYAELDDENGRVLDVVQATFTSSELSSSKWMMADGRVLDNAPC
jgi:hypothetical protein